MNKPFILSQTVLTPDGLGTVISLHNNRIHVKLHSVNHEQIIDAPKGNQAMTYRYYYKDVQIKEEDKIPISIEELMQKFEGNNDLYRSSALFNGCINSIARGARIEDVLVSVILMMDKSNNQFDNFIYKAKKILNP